MTFTNDAMYTELQAIYGAGLSLGDMFARWQADNPDYVWATAYQWYIDNGAVGGTLGDAANNYWTTLSSGLQLLAEDGHHLRTEDNKFMITE